MQQLSMDFSPATTFHPDNIESMTGQNKRLYDWLKSGNTIHMMSPAMVTLGLGYLNSRISDLRNKCHIKIYDRMVDVNGVKCKEYSITAFKAAIQ
jgi:hypothetical protein